MLQPVKNRQQAFLYNIQRKAFKGKHCQLQQFNCCSYEFTTDQELTGFAAYSHSRHSFSITRWRQSTLLCERTARPTSWSCDVKNMTPSLDVYLYMKNNSAEFHPDPIW